MELLSADLKRLLMGIRGKTYPTRRWDDGFADLFGTIIHLQGRVWNFLGKICQPQSVLFSSRMKSGVHFLREETGARL